MEIQLPSVIGPYRIAASLGSGRHGETYLAMNAVRKHPVALKLFRESIFAETQSVERFVKGAAALAEGGLVHPQIAWTWEAGQEEGIVYLASRLIEGVSLQSKLQSEGSLAWEDALETTRRAARALEFAHSKGQVHGDIKPSNVVLNPQNGAVLTDFGLRALLQSCCPAADIAPHYPLANLEPGGFTPAVDQYALACLVVEMIGGLGFSPLAAAGGAGQPAAIKWPEGLPTMLKNVLRRALSPDPGRRYSSLSKFVEDLEKAFYQSRTELVAARTWRMESEAAAASLAAEQARREAEEAARLVGVEQVRRELEVELKAQEERLQAASGQADGVQTTQAEAIENLQPEQKTESAGPLPTTANSSLPPATTGLSERPTARPVHAPAVRKGISWRGAFLAMLLLAAAASGAWWLRPLIAPTPTPTAMSTFTPAPATTQAPAVVPPSQTPTPTPELTPTRRSTVTPTRRPTQTPAPSLTATPTAGRTLRPTFTPTRTPKVG